MSHHALHRLRRFCFGILCGAGILAGVFVLLCAVRVIDPSLWLGSEAAAPAAASPAQPVPAAAPPPAPAVRLTAGALEDQPDTIPHTGTVIVPMKEPDGSLNYVSALPLAADCGASSADPRRNAAIEALNQREGLHTVALVSCLQDQALADYDPGLALLRRSGSPWRDAQRLTWLDPANPAVQHYLTGICQELARLGFDEILLTGCAFPTEGDLSCLQVPPQRTDTLTDFCQILRDRLSDTPTELSILGAGDQQDGQPPSGQTPALLAAFHRVWTTSETAEALAGFSPAPLPDF